MNNFTRQFQTFLKRAAGTGCVLALSMALHAQPANDECEGALPAAVNTDGTCDQVTSGTTSGSSVSAPVVSCFFSSSTVLNDLWYTFVAPGTDIHMEYASFSITQPFLPSVYGLELLEGECGAQTVLGCSWHNTANLDPDPSIDATSLVPGNTYYVRVYVQSSRTLTFGLCLQASGIPLPVKLGKLSGSRTGNNQVRLSWNTFSEQNNRGFEVQRSGDGHSFENIGFVASKAERGNSNQVTDYDFTDRQAVAVNGFYRLQQTDADGTKTYSNILKMGKAAQAFSLEAAPNPAGSHITIIAGAQPETAGKLSLLDMSGRLLHQYSMTASQLTLDISDLTQGMYLLQYRDATRTHTIKFSRE